MSGRKRKNLIDAFLLIWICIIIFLSCTSQRTLQKLHWTNIIGIDKLGHLFFYSILTLLILLAWRERKWIQTSQSKPYIWAFIGSSSLGLVLEIFQYWFFADRYFDILDLSANIIGSLAGIIIFKFFIKN